MKATILIVDDERMLVETISYNLEKEGLTILSAFDGETALKQAQENKPDLVILDLMLPKISGWEVCRALRQDAAFRQAPPLILMLTARGEELDKVSGLEIGADDYLVKPFSMGELVARVRALLRRAQREVVADSEVLHVGQFFLDRVRHEVRIQEEGGQMREINLPLKEFEMLRVLLTHNGQVVSREKLLESVWGDDFFGDERTIDVHIRWLREKLEANPSQPQHILTVRGVGYKFKA